MALPTVSLPTGSVEFDGQLVRVRGLSRGETMRMAANGAEDPAAMETQMLAYGMDVPLEEVQAWYDAAPSAVVQKLVAKVMELSGLDDLGEGLGGA